MADSTSQLPGSDSELMTDRNRRRKRRRHTRDPNVRVARKSRERWANRRHKVQSLMIMLTAGAILLVVLNSLVMILTDNELIPHLYLVVAVIALIGFIIWGFLRLVEFVVEKRYTSLSTKSKNARRERRKRRKEDRRAAAASGQIE